MAYESAGRFLALHALRLKGFAEAGALAAACGLAAGDVETHLSDLAGDDLALHREGRITGWQLTPAGRARHADEVAEELEASGGRAAVDDAYRRFLDLNAGMLAVCTAWQMRDVDGTSTVNDHTDAGHDAEVLGRLRAIHEQVGPALDALAGALDRYAPYRHRLDSALARVEGGEPEWFTKPMIDSYHTVWFELHEDLLATLGVERAAEASV